MDLQAVGKRISTQRKAIGLTQEQLAAQIGVSAQAVSKWENGHNLPDIDNLVLIARLLKMPYASLVEEAQDTPVLQHRERIFDEDTMYTRVKTFAQSECLNDTLLALKVMKEKHRGQFRKPARYATKKVAYINHPLTMACHAHAMGIRDDSVLAAILLHDVVEDTDTALNELPVSDEVKEIVGLLTFRRLPHMSKEESKALYYEKIRQNPKASLIKAIDRCNNVSTMAGAFSRDKLLEYIEETETYVMPVLDTLKNRYPQYGNAAFLIKYQIISLLETVKAGL